MFRKLLFIFVLGFSASSFSASEEQIQLPYNVALNKPIVFSMQYVEAEEGVSIAASEDFFLTAVKNSGDTTIYNVESGGAKVDSMKGMPAGLDTLITQLVEQSSGLSYAYSADKTGFPIELVESKDVRAFMKKVAKGMDKWLDSFAKSENMNKQQKDQMQAILDEGMAPLLTRDNDELSRLVLENMDLIFAVTGRNLYVDYLTVFDGTRYFEDGELYMETQDEWQIDKQNKKDKTISISMTSALHPEEFPAFLARLEKGLASEYSKEDTKAILDVWSGLKLKREARYVVDMKSGLPISGKIYSETVFEGKTQSKTLEFSSAF